jgi:hypothetical protein
VRAADFGDQVVRELIGYGAGIRVTQALAGAQNLQARDFRPDIIVQLRT